MPYWHMLLYGRKWKDYSRRAYKGSSECVFFQSSSCTLAGGLWPDLKDECFLNYNVYVDHLGNHVKNADTDCGEWPKILNL